MMLNSKILGSIYGTLKDSAIEAVKDKIENFPAKKIQVNTDEGELDCIHMTDDTGSGWVAFPEDDEVIAYTDLGAISYGCFGGHKLRYWEDLNAADIICSVGLLERTETAYRNGDKSWILTQEQYNKEYLED